MIQKYDEPIQKDTRNVKTVRKYEEHMTTKDRAEWFKALCRKCAHSKKDKEIIRDLLSENESMKSALQVIHTWACFDIAENGKLALTARDTLKLCNKALGRETQP